jgi:N-acetylglutamate synthase-like GNAT family acetyltransferase
VQLQVSMQIRFANRQDEAPVRALLESQGATLDLAGVDSDLRNLDQNYFGRDGLFVVAEADGKVIAFAGAKRSESDGQILQLTRLNVDEKIALTTEASATTGDDQAADAIKKRFLAIIQNHAYQMDYKKVVISAV